MLLSLRPLANVADANNFDYARYFEFNEGNQLTLYFELVDLAKNKAADGFKPAGLRYCPVAGATLQCVIKNIDNSKVVTRFATQPYSVAGSIWALSVLSTDLVRGTATISLTLTEGSLVTQGNAFNVIRVSANNSSF